MSHYHLGKKTEAIQSYRKALELATDSYTVSDIWNKIGVSYYDLGDFEVARKTYDNAIEAYTNNPKVWYNKALTLRKLNDEKGVQICLDKAKEMGFRV